MNHVQEGGNKSIMSLWNATLQVFNKLAFIYSTIPIYFNLFIGQVRQNNITRLNFEHPKRVLCHKFHLQSIKSYLTRRPTEIPTTKNIIFHCQK